MTSRESTRLLTAGVQRSRDGRSHGDRVALAGLPDAGPGRSPRPRRVV